MGGSLPSVGSRSIARSEGPRDRARVPRVSARSGCDRCRVSLRAKYRNFAARFSICREAASFLRPTLGRVIALPTTDYHPTVLEAPKGQALGGAQVRGLDGFCARKATLGMVRMSWSGHQEKTPCRGPVPLTRPPAIKERSLVRSNRLMLWRAQPVSVGLNHARARRRRGCTNFTSSTNMRPLCSPRCTSSLPHSSAKRSTKAASSSGTWLWARHQLHILPPQVVLGFNAARIGLEPFGRKRHHT